MNKLEKLSLLEDILGVEEGTLNENLALDQITEWDSMAVISLIAIMDEKFGKTIPSAQIRKFKSVKDILDLMEE